MPVDQLSVAVRQPRPGALAGLPGREAGASGGDDRARLCPSVTARHSHLQTLTPGAL